LEKVPLKLETLTVTLPQGSFLGPLLFSLYINDIKKFENKYEIYLFADDTCFFCTDSCYNSLNDKCNLAIQECKDWLDTNKLTLNMEKTHFVNFSKSKKDSNNIDIRLRSYKIKEKTSTKYLGMILQNDLKWNLHIESIIKAVNSQIPLYYELRDKLPQSKKILVYKAITFSKINYGIELYARKETIWVKQLQKTQNRLLKILLKKKLTTRTNLLHAENCILKISDQSKLRLNLIAHNVAHAKNAINTAYIQMEINSHSGRILRNSLDFTINSCYYSPTNKVIESCMIQWNNLSLNNKNISTRQKFKEEIMKLLLATYSGPL